MLITDEQKTIIIIIKFSDISNVNVVRLYNLKLDAIITLISWDISHNYSGFYTERRRHFYLAPLSIDQRISVMRYCELP